MSEEGGRVGGDRHWAAPQPPASDARRLLATLRLHRWLILLLVVLGAAAAGAYVASAKKVYKAEADVLISPVANSDPTTLSLGLITASSNPPGDIETAARLMTSVGVAEAVKAALRLPDSPQQILRQVSAQPVAQSNIVALSAQSGSPAKAAALANAFAAVAIKTRTTAFHAAVRTQTAALQAQLARVAPSSAQAGALTAQLAQLRALAVEPLPDMELSSVATPPSSPVSPRVAIALAAGVIVGLLLGVAAAFVREFFDVRLRQEEQLRELFRLPILARVPRERGLARRPGLQALWGSGRSFSPLTAEAFDAVALESFRTLGAMLVSVRPNGTGKRSVLITSASAGDGKTTTALNLASSLAAAGSEVILIEGDLRRPSIGKALGVSSGAGLLSVLTGQASVSSALVRSPTEPTLRYLLADHGRGPDPMIANALFLPTAATVLARALEFADYVIVDAPPLAEVIDALEIASQVDDVLIAVRLGHTRRPQLVRLGELLSRSHIVPAGLVVLGVPPPRGSRAYPYGYRPHAYSTGDQETAAAGQTGAPTPVALSREEVLRPERSSEGRPSAPPGVEGRLWNRS